MALQDEITKLKNSDKNINYSELQKFQELNEQN